MFTAITLVVMLVPAPTAIVDSVRNLNTVTSLSMLHPGTVLDLGEQGRIRLAYFASCVHETIRGGRLRIGVTASITVEGIVERITGDCDPPILGRYGTGAIGALVLRNASAPQMPVWRLRTTQPTILASPGERIEINRQQPSGHQVFLTATALVTRLDQLGLHLDEGALYDICSASRCRRVWVDPDQSHAHGPILERVVQLE